jgi:hypothetical protein
MLHALEVALVWVAVLVSLGALGVSVYGARAAARSARAAEDSAKSGGRSAVAAEAAARIALRDEVHRRWEEWHKLSPLLTATSGKLDNDRTAELARLVDKAEVLDAELHSAMHSVYRLSNSLVAIDRADRSGMMPGGAWPPMPADAVTRQSALWAQVRSEMNRVEERFKRLLESPFASALHEGGSNALESGQASGPKEPRP